MDRSAIAAEIEKLALGEHDLSGRALTARMTALRVAEHMSRAEEEPAPETPPQQQLDYPVNEVGTFDPSARPELWPLRLNWAWEAGSEREGRAISAREKDGRRERWLAEGSPWSRSQWERDALSWVDALAALPV